jgi:hypothetical protein
MTKLKTVKSQKNAMDEFQERHLCGSAACNIISCLVILLIDCDCLFVNAYVTWDICELENFNASITTLLLSVSTVLGLECQQSIRLDVISIPKERNDFEELLACCLFPEIDPRAL